jgi:AcrR family transcriptional regulator
MSSRSRRRYDSAQRKEAAEATQARVLDAARFLFSRRGIDKVTIAEIAKRAGVAGSTIYALYASKVGILRAIMQAALFGPSFRAAHNMLAETKDLAKLIELTAHVARAIYESESAELGLLRGASSLSPELRKLEAEFEEIRFEMQRERIDLLFSHGLARPGLDKERARRIMWMYTSRDIYRMLVDESGWTPDEYQAWLSRTLADALMGDKRL